MSTEKKYAVYVGHKPGLYDSWSEAKPQVEGYPGNCHEKVQPSGNNKRYVVEGGRKDGVYDSWREAHANSSGYPGARVEKVKSKQGSSSSSKKGYYYD